MVIALGQKLCMMLSSAPRLELLTFKGNPFCGPISTSAENPILSCVKYLRYLRAKYIFL